MMSYERRRAGGVATVPPNLLFGGLRGKIYKEVSGSARATQEWESTYVENARWPNKLVP